MSIDRVTDEELVARAREGDAAAFGELVLRHQSAVYRAALAAVSVPSDADDVAQEAFLLAYTRLGSFRGAARMRGNRRRANTRWWRRIVDVGAADAVSVDHLERAGDPAAFTSTSDTPEQLAAAAELRRDIRRAIAQLPRKLRDALLLAQSGEHSYQEIGAMLGAPIGTVKWRVSEARRVIKASLRTYRDAGQPE